MSNRSGSTFSRARLAAIGAAAACAATLLALPGSPPSATAAHGESASCFWVGPFTTKRGPEFNQAFPDSGAIYWTARYTTPPGATLELHGKFAHARYQSVTSYSAASAGPIDALNDLHTNPNPGSVNPFRPGARRDARHRRYTVAVSTEPPPASPGQRTPNTLYAGAQGQSDQELIYRVYVPDRGRGFAGGTRLPKPTLKLADDSVLRGKAECDLLGSEGNLLDASTLPLDAYLSLRDQPGKPPTFPAQDPPLFGAFYSTAYTLQCVYQDVCDPHPARSGGQYSNLDNAYLGAFVNREFGHVLVIRGKLPRTPRTYAREKRMGRGQLRYWSLCQNESFATTKAAGCIHDEQVPLHKHRRYVIVTSLPGDRPGNARRRCGVGFVRWPAHGDGAGHPDDGLVLVRNMLPSSGFHHAIQDTKVPGDEAKVMGPYLPRGKYMSKREFERRGC